MSDEDNQQFGEDTDSHEVFARFGLAIYMAQVVEHELVNTLSALRLLPARADHGTLDSWESEVDRFFDENHANTFGTMIRSLEKTGKLPETLIQDLRTARSERDFLAHNFFRHHVDDFLNTSGRRAMIKRADTARDKFKKLDEALEAFSRPLMAVYGITQEDIDAEIQSHLTSKEQD